VITYSLVGEALLAKAPGEGRALTRPLRIVNPSSSEHVFLRTSLRASLLATLAANLRTRTLCAALFEAARVYIPRDGELPQERERVVGVIAGRRPDRWRMAGREPVDFYDAKGIVEFVLDRLGLVGEFRAAEDADLMPGRMAEILVGEQPAGVVGQVHPEVAAGFDLNEEVFLVELRLEALLADAGRMRGYRPIARFPVVKHDLDVVVASDVAAAQIAQVIARGRYVVDVRPWDLFTGGAIPAGQKSITFAVSYQAPDHTLTDEEVLQSQRRIEQQLARQLDAHQRATGSGQRATGNE